MSEELKKTKEEYGQVVFELEKLQAYAQPLAQKKAELLKKLLELEKAKKEASIGE